MNRGFSYYLKKSSDLCSFVFGKQKFKDKLAFVLYMVASTIGKLFFLTRPLFLVADQNMANMIVNGHSFTIFKAFHGAKERYFKIFFSELAIGMIYFALALIIVAPGALLYIAYYQYTYATIAVIVLAVAWLITVIAINYNFRFLSFVAARNNELDFSDYIYNSRISTRGIKGMLFGTDLVWGLLTFLLPVLMIGSLVLLVFIHDATRIYSYNGPYNPNQPLFIILAVLIIIGLVILNIFVIAPAQMKHIVSIYMIAEDNCKTTKSIVVKRKASNKVEYEPLFDEDSKIEPVDLNK